MTQVTEIFAPINHTSRVKLLAGAPLELRIARPRVEKASGAGWIGLIYFERGRKRVAHHFLLLICRRFVSLPVFAAGRGEFERLKFRPPREECERGKLTY